MIKIKGRDTSGVTRPMVNLGATLDIVTGSYITGPKGDSILNGGASGIIAVVGRGNSFKSTIANYICLKVLDVMRDSTIPSALTTYDTESSMSYNIDRYNLLASHLSHVPKDPLNHADVWSIIDANEVDAEEFIDGLVEYSQEVLSKPKIEYECFKDRYTGKLVKYSKQDVVCIDSLSEFESAKSANIVSDGKINESQTMFMNDGMFKAKFLKSLPRITTNSNTTVVLTAHVGNSINMASSPYAPQPVKDLQHMRADENIKNVSNKMFFLTNVLWKVQNVSILINRNTNLPEYPIGDNDNSTDLNIVRMVALRSKSGPSGIMVELVVSQTEGVLPTLTEFHLIKREKWGLDGSVRSYNLSIYPDVKLSRTTVRGKIDSDARLRRAMKFTAEILQMKTYMKTHASKIMSMDKLYTKIKERGYDWDKILDSRDHWTVNHYSHKRPYLSSLDLLKIAAGDIERKEFKSKEVK